MSCKALATYCSGSLTQALQEVVTLDKLIKVAWALIVTQVGHQTYILMVSLDSMQCVQSCVLFTQFPGRRDAKHHANINGIGISD